MQHNELNDTGDQIAHYLNDKLAHYFNDKLYI